MSGATPGMAVQPSLDDMDRRIIVATQAGLPLTARPFDAIAQALEIDTAEVLERVQRMQENGIIRRIGAVPNHYAIGYRANGMTVWDVPDESVANIGAKIGALPFVSHCYHRPRHLPLWRYNLFAMVHGKSRDDVQAHVDTIIGLLGDTCRAHDVLFSTRILKKTGLRLAA